MFYEYSDFEYGPKTFKDSPKNPNVSFGASDDFNGLWVEDL